MVRVKLKDGKGEKYRKSTKKKSHKTLRGEWRSEDSLSNKHKSSKNLSVSSPKLLHLSATSCFYRPTALRANSPLICEVACCARHVPSVLCVNTRIKELSVQPVDHMDCTRYCFVCVHEDSLHTNTEHIPTHKHKLNTPL